MLDKSKTSNESDRCVKCGLCLPECPTYRLTLNESDSPRGRIAIIDAMLGGSLSVDTITDQYLDNCLLCRRCEKICPSEVPFAKIMDRARTRTLKYRTRRLRYLVDIISRPKLLGKAVRMARWGQLAGGNRWLAQLAAYGRRTGGSGHTIPPGRIHQAEGRKLGTVGLFTGCTGRALEPETLGAAITMLNKAGYEVRVPLRQTCCGALHAHLGDAATARQMQEHNVAAFDEPGLDAIVSITTGCGSHLADYEGLSSTHRDICSFLAGANRLSELEFAPLPATAALHIPCSQENVLGGGGAVSRLLGLIPELKLLPAQEAGRCCGAAGTYFLSHTETAEKLRQPIAGGIDQIDPEYLVSSNLGCALHIAQGLHQADPAIVHPITLLARQLVRD